MEDPLLQLKELLLSQEHEKLRSLDDQVRNFTPQAEGVARILPKAVTLSHDSGKELNRAIRPVLEATLHLSIRQNPGAIADAIFPVMGPAIRKYIANAMEEMVGNLNRLVESSFSPSALRWRWQSWTTGKSFAEIVLRHGLLFRVEDLFLVHRKSGLLLLHLARPGSEARDADLVTSMLTAIRDFSQDSFSNRDKQRLESIQMENRIILMEDGGTLALAAVVFGTAPGSLRGNLQESLEEIERSKNWNELRLPYRTSDLEAVRPVLENCLRNQAFKPQKNSGRKFSVFLFLALLALCIWSIYAYIDARKWSRAIDSLEAEPGLVIASVRKEGGIRVVKGLRDPLAREPSLILKNQGVDLSRIRYQWAQYVDLAEVFTLTRAEKILLPPKGTTLRMEKGTLLYSGIPSGDWVAKATERSRGMAGVGVDGFALDRDFGMRLLENLSGRLNGFQLSFAEGNVILDAAASEILVRLGESLDSVGRLSTELSIPCQVKVYGQSSTSGSEKLNRHLIQARALEVERRLRSRGTIQYDLETVDPADAVVPGSSVVPHAGVILSCGERVKNQVTEK